MTPSPARSRRLLAFAVPALATAMLALVALPAEVWRAPAYDAVYHGFDPNLVFTDPGGAGQVRVTTSAVQMTAPPNSEPSMTMATTELPRFDASADVRIAQGNTAERPFRFGVWSPWTASGAFVDFGPEPSGLITAETIASGDSGSTLLGGTVQSAASLGSYQPEQSYRIAIRVDKTLGSISISVTDPEGSTHKAVVTKTGALASLFGAVQVSVNGSAFAGSGRGAVAVQNYVFSIPHQRSWAVKIDDPTASAILGVLAFLGLAAIALGLIAHTRQSTDQLRRRVGAVLPRLRRSSQASLLLIAISVVAFGIGNALLFPLGGHPFDMGGEKLWAYVATQYGAGQLYFLPSITSLVWIWHGAPYIESAFPYGPVTAYLTTATGWIDNWLFAGGAAVRLDDVRPEYVIKALNVAFGFFDAFLIYWILLRIGVRGGWALIPAAFFLFNPAVWFSMSVWGQTHVISLFFVLAAVLLAESEQPTGAWLALAAGCLTRPQMLVFGLVLGIVFLKKFSWSRNLSALSWTVIVCFVVFAPLAAVTSPSLPVDVMLHNLRVQEAGGNVGLLTTVSQGGMSIWPLVTYFVRGASSFQRAFTPSQASLLGPLTYQGASQILTAGTLLLISVVLALKKRTDFESGAYLPYVALAIGSFLMLLTGILATHFLLALPFLLLCHRWVGTTAYLYAALVWTVSTLVPMYGDMGALISTLDYPLLSPSHNALTHLMVQLYGWDRFITTDIVANMCALLWVVYMMVRPPGETQPMHAAATT